MTCQHLNNNICLVSTRLAGIDVAAAEDACIACKAQANPMDVNHVTASKAIYTLTLKGKSFDRTLLRLVNSAVEKQSGPGTELEKLISWFKKKNNSCGCSSRIQKMNAWGPNECEKRIDTIVRWLRHSAAKQKVPFIKPVAEKLIKRAIENARKQMASRDNDSTTA